MLGMNSRTPLGGRSNVGMGMENGIFKWIYCNMGTHVRVFMMVVLFCFVTLLVLNHATIGAGRSLPRLDISGHGSGDVSTGADFAPLSVFESWAQYSPEYPVHKYTEPPKECKITQVNILQRHGARFPTSSATKSILAGLNKLQSAKSYTHHSLDFLKHFTYDLGTDVLVPLGALQSYLAGETSFSRYEDLVSKTNIPFVRASGSERVIDSAMNWTTGFSFASHHRYNPVLSVVFSEDPTANNTLDDSGCPFAGDSDEQLNTWVNIYAPPIADRLNSLAVGMTANLTASDVHNLIALCPFESVAKSNLSQFCSIFDHKDFVGFEWAMNVQKYYGTGYGQPIGGRVQGVGYVNELIARLTHTPVRDNTQTNRTLTSNPATFPLDRTIYADFSHDNQMIAIYAAMGLFNETGEVLDPTRINPKTEWDMSNLVPFSAHMAVERLDCASSSSAAALRKRRGQYLRILVNDAVQPLSFCGGDKDGLCLLERFVESQSYARHDGEGDFEKCFVAS